MHDRSFSWLGTPSQENERSCILLLGVPSQENERSCILLLGVPSQENERSCIVYSPGLEHLGIIYMTAPSHCLELLARIYMTAHSDFEHLAIKYMTKSGE
jgi:hypothetical protein